MERGRRNIYGLRFFTLGRLSLLLYLRILCKCFWIRGEGYINERKGIGYNLRVTLN